MSLSSSQVVIQDDSIKVKNADKSGYRSLPIMTKYEFNQVIALRTMHLAKNAPPLIDLPDGFRIKSNMELRAVAIQELQQKKLPYIIKRVMPNGKTEYWNVEDLHLASVDHLFRTD